MSSNQFPQITEAELEVMKVLWQTGSTTSAEIISRLSHSIDWKPKTIHTLITRLVAKNAVSAQKLDGKSYLYAPLVSEADYKSQANRSFLKKLYDGSIHLMLASFLKEQPLSREELAELRKMLEKEES